MGSTTRMKRIDRSGGRRAGRMQRLASTAGSGSTAGAAAALALADSASGGAEALGVADSPRASRGALPLVAALATRVAALSVGAGACSTSRVGAQLGAATSAHTKARVRAGCIGTEDRADLRRPGDLTIATPLASGRAGLGRLRLRGPPGPRPWHAWPVAPPARSARSPHASRSTLALTALLALVGCHSAGVATEAEAVPPAGSSRAAPSAIETEVDPPYPLPRPPEAKPVCFGEPIDVEKVASDTRGAVLHIELAPLPLFPVPFGARAENRPLGGGARSLATQARQLEGARESLRRCYRWARFAAPELEGKLVAHYEISPLGEVTDVTIDDAARWGELGGCVRDVLGARSFTSFTPRRTRATAEVVFERSGLGKPDARPERPLMPSTTKRSGCVRAAEPLPVDELAIGAPRLTVSDFDADQAATERLRTECKNQPGPCRVALATDRGGGMIAVAVARPRRTSASLRDAVEANRGAFSKCWLEARPRGTVQREEVEITTGILADGRTRRATMVAPSGDAAFDACLTGALDGVVFDGGPDVGLTVLRVAFRLMPVAPSVTPAPARDTPENVALLAEVALIAGDGDTALRRLAALAREGRSCEVQLAMLRALLLARPWADVPALMAATDLVGLAPRGGCRAESVEPLAEVVRRVFDRADAVGNPELYEEAVLRAQLALRLGEPSLDGKVRPLLERALRHLGRDDDLAALGGGTTRP